MLASIGPITRCRTSAPQRRRTKAPTLSSLEPPFGISGSSKSRSLVMGENSGEASSGRTRMGTTILKPSGSGVILPSWSNWIGAPNGGWTISSPKPNSRVSSRPAGFWVTTESGPRSSRPSAVGSVRIRPPSFSPASISQTRWPARLAYQAALSPAIPPPMTATRGWLGCGSKRIDHSSQKSSSSSADSSSASLARKAA